MPVEWTSFQTRGMPCGTRQLTRYSFCSCHPARWSAFGEDRRLTVIASDARAGPGLLGCSFLCRWFPRQLARSSWTQFSFSSETATRPAISATLGRLERIGEPQFHRRRSPRTPVWFVLPPMSLEIAHTNMQQILVAHLHSTSITRRPYHPERSTNLLCLLVRTIIPTHPVPLYLAPLWTQTSCLLSPRINPALGTILYRHRRTFHWTVGGQNFPSRT